MLNEFAVAGYMQPNSRPAGLPGRPAGEQGLQCPESDPSVNFVEACHRYTYSQGYPQAGGSRSRLLHRNSGEIGGGFKFHFMTLLRELTKTVYIVFCTNYYPRLTIPQTGSLIIIITTHGD